MTDDRPAHWFAAKKYGWGWGLPISWQGWTVLSVWLAAMVGLAVALAPHHRAAFFGGVAAGGGLLIAVCWLKGEPPRWR